MHEISDMIRQQVPSAYLTEYPRAVRVLELYYEWMQRREGLSLDEIRILQEEKDWLKSDIAKFQETGQVRYSGSLDESTLDYALIQESNTKIAEAQLDRYNSFFLLERVFDFAATSDEFMIQTSDGYNLDLPYYDESILDEWFYRLGFDYEATKRGSGLLDETLLIRNLKHIYAIKGTYYAIQTFFNIYFGENIEFYNPKFDIAAIDYNFVPDGTNSIRDDDYYNEYSYVVLVDKDPSEYSELLNSIYLKYIHPSGFKIFLKQKTK